MIKSINGIKPIEPISPIVRTNNNSKKSETGFSKKDEKKGENESFQNILNKKLNIRV